MLRRHFARYPLTDRVTYYYELWAGAFYGLFSGLFLTLAPIVARRIGVSSSGLALMLTMPFVGSLFGLLSGHLAGRLGYMRVQFWPVLCSRLVLLALVFVREPRAFLLVVCAHYLLSNLTGPAYAAIMRANYSTANRGEIMGNIRIVVLLGSGLCSSIAGFVLSAEPEWWPWVFASGALMGVLSVLFFRRIKVRQISDDGPSAAGLRPPPRRRVPVREAMAVLGKDRAYLGFVAILFFCAFPMKLAIPLEPLRFVDDLDISYRTAGVVLGSVVAVSGMLGYYLWPKLAKRFDNFTLFAWVAVLSSIRLLIIAMATKPGHLTPASIIGGFANGGWELVALFCLMRLADPAYFPLYMGLNSTALGIRGLAGPAIGTAIYESGTLSMQAIFAALAAFLMAGAILAFMFSRRARRLPAVAARGPVPSPGSSTATDG